MNVIVGSRTSTPARSFLAWTAFYTPAEVAQILKISTDSVLRKFARVKGVIDVGTEENLRKHTRRRRMLRIPHDVLQRFIQSSRVQ